MLLSCCHLLVRPCFVVHGFLFSSLLPSVPRFLASSQIRTNYTKEGPDWGPDWGYYFRNVPSTFTNTDTNCREPTRCSTDNPSTSVSVVTQ